MVEVLELNRYKSYAKNADNVKIYQGEKIN